MCTLTVSHVSVVYIVSSSSFGSRGSRSSGSVAIFAAFDRFLFPGIAAHSFVRRGRSFQHQRRQLRPIPAPCRQPLWLNPGVVIKIFLCSLGLLNICLLIAVNHRSRIAALHLGGRDTAVSAGALSCQTQIRARPVRYPNSVTCK